MKTEIDFKSIYMFAKKNVLTKKFLAVAVALGCVLFAYNVTANRIVPMSCSSDGSSAPGADINDLAATGLSVLTALISFVASQYMGVKPEIIQAVVAYGKDTTNEDNQRRLGAALLGYVVDIVKKHPEGQGGYVLNIITTLSKNIEDPKIGDILNTAGKALAAVQYKTVDSKEQV